jgi:hypothetical protein
MIFLDYIPTMPKNILRLINLGLNYSNDSIKGYRKIDSLIMAGENLRAFELAESIYNRYINDYGSEENIDVRLKQSFQMTKSRMEYLKK